MHEREASSAVHTPVRLLLLLRAAQVALKLEQPQQLELWARLGNMLLSDGLLAPQLEGSLQAAMRASEAAGGGHQR
jgi:hypothetical protein